MAEKLLRKYKTQIKSITILPSTGGVFQVTAGDNVLFSKKEQKRFPEFEDIDKNFMLLLETLNN